jgi:XisH protein
LNQDNMAKDRFHDVVKSALEAEGWTITHDPYEIRVGDVDFEIDLAADKLLAAQKDHQKIAVEIKSFIGTSNVSEFHVALGQFINYRYALEEKDPDRQLYLAVPKVTYNTFFKRQFVASVVQRSNIALIVYDPQQGGIVQWL